MKNLYRILLASLLFVLCLPSTSQAESKTITVDSKALILPVLELTLTQQGTRELRFGEIAPSGFGPTEAEPKLIAIDVLSNSGEKYQVTQALSGALQNAEGAVIELGNLKFKTTAPKSTGSVVPDFTAVSDKSQTIFTSDEQGNSASIFAEYRLSIPSTQAPGDYSALLTYTVSAV
jgi:hypothetical protein